MEQFSHPNDGEFYEAASCAPEQSARRVTIQDTNVTHRRKTKHKTKPHQHSYVPSNEPTQYQQQHHHPILSQPNQPQVSTSFQHHSQILPTHPSTYNPNQAIPRTYINPNQAAPMTSYNAISAPPRTPSSFSYPPTLYQHDESSQQSFSNHSSPSYSSASSSTAYASTMNLSNLPSNPSFFLESEDIINAFSTNLTFSDHSTQPVHHHPLQTTTSTTSRPHQPQTVSSLNSQPPIPTYSSVTSHHSQPRVTPPPVQPPPEQPPPVSSSHRSTPTIRPNQTYAKTSQMLRPFVNVIYIMVSPLTDTMECERLCNVFNECIRDIE